jgi:hypothetical protein
MAALKDEVKMFIVQQLACHDTPSQVAESVKDMFGLDVNRAQIQTYDPYKSQGRNLSAKFKDIFDATRKAFLAGAAEIPIASKAFRLRALHRSYEFFVSKKNHIAANQVLEQAAKEVGEFYTNKIKLSDNNGNALSIWLNQIGGSSLPIAKEVEGQVIEQDAAVQDEKKEPAKALTKPIKKKPIVERD